MDRSEKLAQDHLTSRGYTDVRYEPDGNIPPDFLVHNEVAIEVRRLNQNEMTSVGRRGLEEVFAPLERNLRQWLKLFGPPTLDSSWYVFYTFKRPLPKWKTLRQLVLGKLTTFLQTAPRRSRDIAVAETLTLKLVRAEQLLDDQFVLFASVDFDSGGYLVHEFIKNLDLCFTEKKARIEPVRHKYCRWWLVFIDQIAHGLSEYDFGQLRTYVQVPDPWEKIIIVDPRDPRQAYEISR